jgi:hypothetical protein
MTYTELLLLRKLNERRYRERLRELQRGFGNAPQRERSQDRRREDCRLLRVDGRMV